MLFEQKNFSHWLCQCRINANKISGYHAATIRKPDTMNTQIYALKIKLNAMSNDLLTKPGWKWSELVEQQAKIRALKTKITKMENAR
jgi:hypothetical protein